MDLGKAMQDQMNTDFKCNLLNLTNFIWNIFSYDAYFKGTRIQSWQKIFAFIVYNR